METKIIKPMYKKQTKNAGYIEKRDKDGNPIFFKIGNKKNYLKWTGKKMRVFKNGKEIKI